MIEMLNEARFDYVPEADKAFLRAFDAEMNRLGYDFGGSIGSGYCWGRHMLIYRKTGAKSQNVAARVYLREGGIVLRLFLNKLDNHRVFLENTPPYIKEVFVGKAADCRHDRQDADGGCKFRKSYTLDGRLIEKCNGETFEFHQPSLERLPDYVALFAEFYGPKGRRQPASAPG